MDVLLRLRVLIWILVVSLWGLMVYQYLGEEEQEIALMKRVAPYRAPSAPPAGEAEPPSSAPAPSAPSFPAAPEAPLAPPLAEPAAAPPSLVKPPSDYVGPAPSPGRETPAPPVRRPRPYVEDRSVEAADVPVPRGFVKSATRHFVVFSEGEAASERFLETIENLHSNLMLDLAPFSPWAREERTTIFLFKDQETYRRGTGRPAWSGGASSVGKRKLYVYETDELAGMLAHELTHIYFDGFFLEGVSDPLWLSEGMATLVQVERGLAAPHWLRENLELLEGGAGLSIEEMAAVSSTKGWPDDKVRLWYAQAYSVVRFLIRTQYRSSFYKFAANLRDGRSSAESLYRAYGAPYTRLKALEYAWRYELSRAAASKTAGR